jgi:hypothetical protein
VKRGCAIQRSVHVGLEVQDFEAVTAQDPSRATRRREPHVVPERQKLPRNLARPKGVIRPAVRNATEYPHAISRTFTHGGSSPACLSFGQAQPSRA